MVRAAHETEWMDDPQADLSRLERTYRQFAWMNRILSGWGGIYRGYLRPVLRADPARSWSLLDIVFGGGDIPLRLASLAARDGVSLEIEAIDPDPRALSFVQRTKRRRGVVFRCADTESVIREGRTFDFVVSNHLLHHLEDEAVASLLDGVESICRHTALMSDIRRTAHAPALFRASAGLVFHRSYLVADGLISIRRSFTVEELRRLLPPGWEVSARPLSRLLAVRTR